MNDPIIMSTIISIDQDQDQFECPICYIDIDIDTSTSSSSSTAGIVLTTCQHQSCTPCLVRWIEKEETSGQEAPTCPICRVDIEDEDVHQIIGRSFEPRGKIMDEANSEEIDEFTLHWLNENTALCEGCGSRIEKESGCNLIECLCGYRFCYHCNAPGGRCECNEGHGFLGLEWGSHEEYIIQPVRDSNGFVDLKSCIEQRRRKLEGEWIRQNRYYQRQEQWEESEMFWGCMQPCEAIETCHGGWIFSCKTNQASSQTLSNVFEAIERGEWIRQNRYYQRQEQWEESEMFWGCMQPCKAIETCHGRWIFSCKTNQASMKMLTNIFEATETAWRRDMTPFSDMAVGSNWLFLQNGADLRALVQLQNRYDMHCMRTSRWCRANDWSLHHSLKMLQRLFDGIEVSRQRRVMRATNEEVPFNNGAWLFS
ncbi:hypothetical protein QTG54_013472 [Skeletonema marinoi]|uniref:RING-type domain-containing protein n=1 Tax=Skeletonema marinoi TaxID=267567 RepID=A0AAD8XYS4_9STRA|nr:hypothetical protein QTG54_013472 [Skeletonema marinoi]